MKAVVGGESKWRLFFFNGSGSHLDWTVGEFSIMVVDRRAFILLSPITAASSAIQAPTFQQGKEA
jgi:hypothetical protein